MFSSCPVGYKYPITDFKPQMWHRSVWYASNVYCLTFQILSLFFFFWLPLLQEGLPWWIISFYILVATSSASFPQYNHHLSACTCQNHVNLASVALSPTRAVPLMHSFLISSILVNPTENLSIFNLQPPSGSASRLFSSTLRDLQTLQNSRSHYPLVNISNTNSLNSFF